MKNNILRTVKMAAFFSVLGLFLQAILVNVLLASSPAEAQNLKSVKVSMNIADVTLEDALQIIEQKTKFSFSYFRENLPLQEKVTVDVTQESLYNILYAFAKDYGLVFQRINKQITVRKADPLKEVNPIVVDKTGIITGKVVDAETTEPLFGANIILKGTTLGAAADANGEYHIENVPVGTYSLSVQMIGYRKVTKPVLVKEGSTSIINFELVVEVFKMDKVVVTAARDPRSLLRIAENVSVVSSKEIDQLPVHSVSEALNYTPGVYMEGLGGIGHTVLPRIYGSPHRNVLVLVDGVPINDQTEGYGDVAQLSTENIERIEVVKGAGSAQWGSTLGGVINIITKSPAKNKVFTGNLTVGYGRWNTQDYRFNFNGTYKGFGYFISGNRLKADDFSLADGSTLGKSDAVSNKGFIKLVSPRYKNFQLSVSYQQTDAKVGMFERPLRGIWRKHDVVLKTGNATLNYLPTDRLNFNFIFDYKKLNSRIQEFPIGLTNMTGDITNDDIGMNAKAKVTAKLTKTNTLVAGFDYLKTKDWSFIMKIFLPPPPNGPGTLVYDPGKKDLTEYALYFNDEQQIGNFNITLSGRYDHNSVFGSYFSPSLGVVYYNDQYRSLVRFLVTSAFDPPTMAYRYAPPSPFFMTLSNPDLKPERALAYSLGLESHYFSFLWQKLTIFKLDMKDLVDFTVITDPSDAHYMWRKADNIGKAYRQGVELELGLELPAGISLYVAACWIEAKDLEKDVLLGDVPAQTYDLGFTYVSKFGFNANVKGHYINENWDPNKLPPNWVSKDKVFVWDVKISQTFKFDFGKLTGYLSLHNLTNKDFGLHPIYYTPARWAEGGITMSF